MVFMMRNVLLRDKMNARDIPPSDYWEGYFEGYLKGIRFAFALLKEESEEKLKPLFHDKKG
jgi:hypothetical protein